MKAAIRPTPSRAGTADSPAGKTGYESSNQTDPQQTWNQRAQQSCPSVAYPEKARTVTGGQKMEGLLEWFCRVRDQGQDNENMTEAKKKTAKKVYGKCEEEGYRRWNEEQDKNFLATLQR
jgi:hypothetical protein